jgi:uncharacterized membrane protein YbhN (UPF0104 family)
MALIQRLRPLLKVLIAASILFIVFRFVPLADVAGTIASARIGYLLAAVPIILLIPYLSARRLKILTDSQGMSLTVRQILEVNFVTRFYGLVMPGELAAGAWRWLRLAQIENRKAEILASILFSRMLHLVGLGLLGVIFFAADGQQGGAVSSVALLMLLGVLSLTVFLLRFGSRSGSGVHPRQGAGGLHRLIASVRSFRNLSRRDWGRLVGLSVAENLVATVMIYVLALAVQVSLPFVVLGWIRAPVQLLVLLPISISGLGVREGSLLLALDPYGVSGANAVALSLILFGASVFTGLIGGILELLRHAGGAARRPPAERRGARAGRPATSASGDGR